MNQNQLYEDLFQKRNSYYLEKLELYENGKKFTFNYATFIFGLLWFLYRKMYLETIVIFLILYTETAFENFFLTDKIGIEQTKLVSFIITILSLIVAGFSGNYLYIKRAKRTIKKAEKKFSEYEQRKKYLTKKGGTQLLYIGILLTLLIVAIILK
ncbi:hypothetical protein BBI01_12670 [Chryseobacterium artocarpi]|uniref:DUF2628 domain-containing protein n=1 Tax=Chryseobacterium artocarpi TaxID=1414727 RepID=A0A1B8ZGQ6_9FLAO|nr:DUF2628 domain-containing protein [Chryseobacterium artocarpi]OCA70788.1 hypothetical protein BBI01_12670 [Chryseobacterium artocarpi]